MKCLCVTYRIAAPKGELLTGVLEHNPDCPEHGFPGDRWVAGAPLRRYAREVNGCLETPSEVTKRLLSENA